METFQNMSTVFRVRQEGSTIKTFYILIMAVTVIALQKHKLAVDMGKQNLHLHFANGSCELAAVRFSQWLLVCPFTAYWILAQLTGYLCHRYISTATRKLFTINQNTV